MPEVTPNQATEERTKLYPRWSVILWNDDDHTYNYVVEMLGDIFGYDKMKAFEMAYEVDRTGKVVVYIGPKEHAEFKRDKIHAYGADPRIPRCKGSMSATLEPAE